MSACHFCSRMEKDSKKSKAFVSTFRFTLKPQARPLYVGKKEEENRLDTTSMKAKGIKKLGVLSATGKHLKS